MNIECKNISAIRGVPFHRKGARIACILLLLFSFLFPLNAQAFELTDSTYIGTFDFPDTEQLYVQFRQQQFNIFLFYEPSTSTYYLLGIKDFFVDNHSYQFYYSGESIYLHMNNASYSYNYGYSNSQYIKRSISISSNAVGRIWFNTTDKYLLAFDMYSKCISNNGDEMFIFGTGTGSDFHLEYISPVTSRLSFNLQGGVDGVDNETQARNTIYAFFQSIISGLGTLGDRLVSSLSDLSTSISGFFTGLGDRISGFFSSLWSDLSTSFTNIGNWFSSLGDRISGFFSTLGDRISGFFSTIYTNITTWFNGLFTLSPEWSTNYHNQWKTWFSQHFGILYQSVEIIQYLFTYFEDVGYDYYSWTDVTIPAIRFPNSSSLPSGIRNKTIYGGNSIDLVDVFQGTSVQRQMFNIYQAVLSGLFYYALLLLSKKKFDKILAGKEL